MIATPTKNSHCPNDAAISALVAGDDASPSVAEHVGECTGCQERLESTATAGAKHQIGRAHV